MVHPKSFDNQNGLTLSDPAQPAQGLKRRGSGWVSMVVGATIAFTVLVGLFGEVLAGSRFLAFRDAMHFFPPLYRLVASEWLSSRVPLLNPWLNGGQLLEAICLSTLIHLPCSIGHGLSRSSLGLG
jgi:hypothetical protein